MNHLELPPYPGVPAVLGGVFAAVLVGVLVHRRRRPGRAPAAVMTAALGALLCTAYSGDTSWRFARDHLDMASRGERSMMFAAAEIGLFAMALMARANLNDPDKNGPGAPGVLVWVVTGVQVIPAYSESGAVAGTVRAFVGPIMAALLWHLAMGIELRHRGRDSQSLPAVLAREARVRLLARLGLTQRGRDALQISRDRWTRIATRRAAHLADLETTKTRTRRLTRARRRLAAAVDRTDAAVLPEQRDVLRDRIAAYRHADGLAKLDLPSPWEPIAPAPAQVDLEPVPDVPEAYPSTPRPVPPAVPAGARMLPIIARPERQQYRLDSFAEQWVPAKPQRVLAAEPPRTRPEVHAEYVPDVPEDDVPEDEPVDDSPPPPAEDNLTAQARGDFRADFMAGVLPTYGDLKTRYKIGQDRAKRIRDEFLRGPV
ncbi:hypothetical protein ACIG63_27140 [Streptomyces antimycoticus]|uniref:hypothetical protein n=1 Tax=Streptomyces antimycoticus TaxID=68175 RepID=UPI0037CD801F